MTLSGGLTGEHVGAVRGGGVVALPGDDDGAVAATDHDRLVARRVPGRGDDQHAGQYLGLAVELLVAQPGRVDELRQGVVGSSSGFEFAALDEDRSARQLRVAAAVVEMQVAVGHKPYVLETRADVGECGGQRPAVRPVVLVDLGVAAHAGVDEQQPIGVLDQVAQARLHTGRAGPGLLRGPNEEAVVQPPHRGIHRHSVPSSIGHRHTSRTRPGVGLPERRTGSCSWLARTSHVHDLVTRYRQAVARLQD